MYDRDTNATKIILASSLALMGIYIAGEAKADEAAMNEVVGASVTAGVKYDLLDAAIPFQIDWAIWKGRMSITAP